MVKQSDIMRLNVCKIWKLYKRTVLRVISFFTFIGFRRLNYTWCVRCLRNAVQKSVNALIYSASCYKGPAVSVAATAITFHVICRVFVSFSCYAYASRSASFLSNRFHFQQFIGNHKQEKTKGKKIYKYKLEMLKSNKRKEEERKKCVIWEFFDVKFGVHNNSNYGNKDVWMF